MPSGVPSGAVMGTPSRSSGIRVNATLAAAARRRRVRHRHPQPLHPRRPRLDEAARADRDRARDADGERVRLRDLRRVDGGAAAVDVIAHHVDRLVDPLPKHILRRRLREQHAHRHRRVHRHKGAHSAGQEHLLARHRVEDGVAHALRLPQVVVRDAARLAGRGVLIKEHLRVRKLRVADEEREWVGQLAKAAEPARVRGLVVAAGSTGSDGTVSAICRWEVATGLCGCRAWCRVRQEISICLRPSLEPRSLGSALARVSSRVAARRGSLVAPSPSSRRFRRSWAARRSLWSAWRCQHHWPGAEGPGAGTLRLLLYGRHRAQAL